MTEPQALSLQGHTTNPLQNDKAYAIVLIFISNDCPISNRYAPEIRRLHQRFAPRGVCFSLVHPDPTETAASIQEHARQYDLNLPLLRDPEHHLVKLAHAKVTPSAAVFARDRQLVYHGRIDNRLTDFGKERPEATEHDLADAIEAVLEHRAITRPETKAIGCYIPGLQ